MEHTTPTLFIHKVFIMDGAITPGICQQSSVCSRDLEGQRNILIYWSRRVHITNILPPLMIWSFYYVSRYIQFLVLLLSPNCCWISLSQTGNQQCCYAKTLQNQAPSSHSERLFTFCYELKWSLNIDLHISGIMFDLVFKVKRRK